MHVCVLNNRSYPQALVETNGSSMLLPISPRDETLLITCLSAKGLRVVSNSEFCADFKK